MASPWIGQSVRRREDPPLITGRGRYAADPNPAETVHLAIRRAGVPHGAGLTVDLAATLAMPGVVGAWTNMAVEHSVREAAAALHVGRRRRFSP